MTWVILVAAIVCEVGATVSLRAATFGRPSLYMVVAAGYLAAFALLILVLDRGLGLGVTYGVWTAVGVALTATASRLLFDEPLTYLMVGGIVLIMCGVVLIELGSH
jgi:small multidrug resistance pump